jgi:hypothetical protein
MFNAAKVLPAGPGERDEHLFPIRERLRFRDNLGLGLREVRRRPAFAKLRRGPWQVFVAIACFWQANAEAWPSQETIASFSGYSSRAVRDYVDVLEQQGIVRTRRERRPNGADRIYYAPGLVTLSELAAFVDRFPRERARPPREVESVALPPPSPPHPPEATSGTPPEATSMEHRDLNLSEPSSCESLAMSASTSTEEKNSIEVTEEDRQVARAALAERMRRKHPKRTPPRWFDAGELAIVAACSSAVEGDRNAKLAAHRHAIDGAYAVSKEGPPTVRFIWEKLEHFLDHVERGRTRAQSLEREARYRDERHATAMPRPVIVSPPVISAAQMRADYERLFGGRA